MREHVEPVVGLAQVGSEFANRSLGREIRAVEPDVAVAVDQLFAALPVAADDGNRGTALGQPVCRLSPDTARTPGEDDDHVFEIYRSHTSQ